LLENLLGQMSERCSSSLIHTSTVGISVRFAFYLNRLFNRAFIAANRNVPRPVPSQTEYASLWLQHRKLENPPPPLPEIVLRHTLSHKPSFEPPRWSSSTRFLVARLARTTYVLPLRTRKLCIFNHTRLSYLATLYTMKLAC